MTKKTVLLADDEAGIRKVLSISLRDLGYTVHTAEDGETALQIFRREKPAIVLTDIKMPGMDGIQLLQKIKQESPGTEVIIITGHGDIDLAIESLKFEATDFVTKPINDEVLEIALQRAQERIAMRELLHNYTQNLEQMVKEKTEKLIQSERMAAVGQSIAGLSHAIKNVAGGLKGGAFVLEKGIELDNQEYLMQGWRMVKGNVEKIANLSLDLLNYTKLADISCRLCNPNAPVKEIVELMTSKAVDHGLILEMDLDRDLKSLYFDPDLIHRALLNLVSNAIDACIENDPGKESKTVVVRTIAVDGWGVEYQVSDTGSGMDAETKSKLFQSFFSTKGTNGTGIGLMLTKKIIDQHGGIIDVESHKGIGSTFRIRLPEKVAVEAVGG